MELFLVTGDNTKKKQKMKKNSYKEKLRSKKENNFEGIMQTHHV